MKKASSILVAAMVLVTLGLFGCGDENTSTTTNVTGPAAGATMKGTVQGFVLDAVTQEPIVGAVVDIGVARATTTENGQYVLRDVPATQARIETNPMADGSGGQVITTTYLGTYYVTINLKGVTKPVNMTSSSSTPRYSDYKLTSLNVSYETIANMVSATTGSTAGTYIVNVRDVSNEDFEIGKMAAAINGTVAYAGTLQPVGADWTVRLVSLGSNNAGGSANGTGANENIVSRTTTTTGGAFSFSNIESRRSFRIEAEDSTGMYRGSETVQAPADGETKTLVIQRDDTTYDLRTVLVSSIDNIAPRVTTVTPENGADLTAGSVSVVFTFSEPIWQTAYATRLTPESVAGGASGLYNDVTVKYMGTKAGNIAHTLSWNSANDQLTVTIPSTAVSSKYWVGLCDDADDDQVCDSLAGDTLADLEDASTNNVSNIETAGRGSIMFTTNGGATAAAPTITAVNSASMNNTGSPSIDWLPVSGAKSYNVYRSKSQVWTSATNTHAMERVNTTPVLISEAVDGALNFVENDQVKLTYSYVVKSVNSDGSESAASNMLTFADVLGPLAGPATFSAAGTSAWRLDLTDGDDTLQVVFDEPLDETSAEVSTNYTINVASGTAPTATSAVYHFTSGGPYWVDLTLSANLTPANLGRTQIYSGPNGVCEYTAAGDDVVTIVSGNGSPNATCVTENVAGTAATGVAGGSDDVQVIAVGAATTVGAIIVTAGPDGVCDTTATGGENQVIPVSQGLAGQLCASAGPDLWLDSTLGGDDTLTQSAALTVTGVKDVAGNTVRGAGDQVTSDGARQ